MNRTINGGLYLVVDPALPLDDLLIKTEKAIHGGIDVIQVWNNWHPKEDKRQVITAICHLAHKHNIPVIVNEEWNLLQSTSIDGVHFDTLPADINYIRQSIVRPFLCGLTCGNDLNRVRWAAENKISYISFCSLFPSPSVGECEIVKKETVQQARKLTSLPIFLAGGITLENLTELAGTGMNGIALISAIMKADDPQRATQAFKQKLKTINHETLSD